MKLIEMPFEDWSDKYKPVMIDGEERRYETYGKDIEHISAMDFHKVWTALEVDGNIYLSNGIHWVNRLFYIVTELPWNDGEDIEVSYSGDQDEE